MSQPKRVLVLFVTHVWSESCSAFLNLASKALRDHTCVFIYKGVKPLNRLTRFLQHRCDDAGVNLHIAPQAGYDFDGYIHALGFATSISRPIGSHYTHHVFINNSVFPARLTAVQEMLDVLDTQPDVGLVGATINARFKFFGLNEKVLHPHVQSGAFAVRADVMRLLIKHNILSGPLMDKGGTILGREIKMSTVILKHAGKNIAETAGMYKDVDFREIHGQAHSLSRDPKSKVRLIDTIYHPHMINIVNSLLAQNRLTFVKQHLNFRPVL
jgi:hypothetical protein